MALKGVPVVVVPSGGVPIRAVDQGAPLMTVSDTGAGTPITYTDLGAPMVVTSEIPPPVPGPLDFGSGDYGLTEYTTAFDVAAPHIVMGMTFYYTGNPVITVMHEGEPLEGRVQLNAGHGALVFIGDDLTVETGSLVITCTGGTFGPFAGRVNEMPFAPNMATLEWIAENFQANTKSFYHTGGAVGRVYGAVASGWWTGQPTCTPLEVKVAMRDFYGPGIGWTPGLDGFNWTWDTGARVATHVGSNVDASRASEFDAEAVGPYRFRADISYPGTPPTTTSVQYRNAAGTSGANATVNRYGSTLSGLWSGPDAYKKFELRMGGDVEVSNIRIYNSTVAAYAICGVIASGDNVTSWFYSSPNNMSCAAVSLKVEPL